jgi:ribonuclease HI
MAEQPIVVFTDGAAKGNPGPGGWGAVVVTPDGHVTECRSCGRAPLSKPQ